MLTNFFHLDLEIIKKILKKVIVTNCVIIKAIRFKTLNYEVDIK